MKLHLDYLEWGKYTNPEGKIKYQHWFYWWNWLPPKYRYWGFEHYFYDHPMVSFGFWFFNWSWYTQWTDWSNI